MVAVPIPMGFLFACIVPVVVGHGTYQVYCPIIAAPPNERNIRDSSLENVIVV